MILAAFCASNLNDTDNDFRVEAVPFRRERKLKMKPHRIWLILLALFLQLFANSFIYAAETQRDKLVAAYIFRIAEHIQWANEAKIERYRIHIIDDRRDLANYLKDNLRSKQLHGKPLAVTRSGMSKAPADAHLIFISNNKADSYPSVFQQTEGSNVLLISEGLADKRQVMINLAKSSRDQIRFELNKANVLNQNLGIKPDIILLGGTEIDVAQLYREGQQALQQQQKQLAELQHDIEIIGADKRALAQTLAAQRKEVQQLQRMTGEQEKELTIQARQLRTSSDELRIQKTRLKTQEKIINKQENLIREQTERFDDLQRQIQVQEKNIKRQAESLKEREAQLTKQNQEIEKRTAILDGQQQRIAQQDALIETQQATIGRQSVAVSELGDVVSSQKQTLYLLAATVAMALMLVILTLQGYRSKKKSNIRLAQAQKEAEAANEAKSNFLANMSHELRTPLNAILGYSQILAANDELPETSAKQLAIVNRSGEHLLAMINDVLDISKIEAGRIELEAVSFDLPQVLAEVSEMLRVRAQAANLSFIVDTEPDMVRFVHGDMRKLRQILINLLGNAVKFTSAGGVSLRAKTQPMAGDPARLTLRLNIEDSGPGIAEAQLASIFEPFVQVAQNYGDAKGTGLGLSITKSFVEQMGGEINVESTLGKGTRFRIKLPLERVSSAAGVPKIERSRHVRRLAPEQPVQRILVVDDDRENLLLLKGLLHDVGFEVGVARNGEEAVARFREWTPHLIWMDIRMPVMDGFEATRQIRQSPGGEAVKILALTASVFKEHRKDILDAGCDEVMYKPFVIQEIFAAMSQQLGVNYIYGNEQIHPVALPTELTQEQLATLTPDLQDRLGEAARRLDIDGTATVIEQVRSIDEGAADGLQALVEGYRFGRIVSLLDKET